VIPTATAAATPLATPVPATEAPAARPSAAGAIKLPSELEVEVHGRFHTGVSMDERDDWSRELGLREARIAVEARLGQALTVVEADLASRTPIKDAYLQLDGPFATRLVAGRFKAPFSERRVVSSWKLPLIGRGLVNEYVAERNAIGGRRLGVVGEVRPWGRRVRLEGGVFASDPGDANDGQAEDYAARVELKPWRWLEVGGSGYRAAPVEGGPTREAGAAHLKLELGPVATTVEGMIGSVAAGRFRAATAVATYTLEFLERRLRVAPLAAAEVLQLDDGSGGQGHAAIAGAVISWAGGLKLKVQGERARRPGDTDEATALALELGTKF
jgi:hypothetical protein